LTEKLKTFYEYRKKIIAYEYIDWLISWDQETQAPIDSANFRSEQVEVLSKIFFDLKSDPIFIEAVEYLNENIDKIDDNELKREIRVLYKSLRIPLKVPRKEYIDYEVTLASATTIWNEARELNDFNHFVPTLEKLVNHHKNIIKYLETDNLKGYDVLLDMYEENANVKLYDEFFEYLKTELQPFVMEVTKGRKYQFNRKLTKRTYPIYEQKRFSRYLIDKLGYDLNRGAIRDTIHPFTSGINTNDIRITSDYYEDNFIKSIFSVIHEVGHAIYEQSINPKYNNTFLMGVPSFGLHEAFARMYENMIGRSYSFWSKSYPKLKEIFPKQLNGIPLLEFYKYVNEAKRSKIRVDADELTYSFHIMVRYEIEKEIFNGNLNIKDIPKRWRTLMAKYVGVRPVDDLEGPLQDIHWATGDFGYFPSYALGSAYAAQIYNAMNKDINVESVIENENIKVINDWLKERIFKYGKSKTTQELLINATGEDFNPKYYIDYLKNKWTKISKQMKANMD